MATHNKIDLIGLTYSTNHCGEVQILEYISSRKVIVQFLNTGHKKEVSMHNLQLGKVEDRTEKLLSPTKFGIGIIGQGSYSCSTHRKIYDKWMNMLQRCYSQAMLEREPSYIGCEVCLEWQNFQNFAKWYEENCPGDGYCLDKDIKIKGNKLYSPQTVLFVPPAINKLFVKQQTQRGGLPIGVQKPKDEIGYLAVCMNPFTKHPQRIGHYQTPELAFQAYKEFKELMIRKMAECYQAEISEDLYKAMLDYEVEITD